MTSVSYWIGRDACEAPCEGSGVSDGVRRRARPARGVATMLSRPAVRCPCESHVSLPVRAAGLKTVTHDVDHQEDLKAGLRDGGEGRVREVARAVNRPPGSSSPDGTRFGGVDPGRPATARLPLACCTGGGASLAAPAINRPTPPPPAARLNHPADQSGQEGTTGSRDMQALPSSIGPKKGRTGESS